MKNRILDILLVNPKWNGFGNRKKIKVSEKRVHPLTLGVRHRHRKSTARVEQLFSHTGRVIGDSNKTQRGGARGDMLCERPLDMSLAAALL